MEGDTFEMEDQRNWTDASFKTYCTPLGLPFPVDVRPGDEVVQTVTVRIDPGDVGAKTAARAASGPEPVRIRPAGEPRPLPAWGFGLGAADDPPLTDEALARITALRPAHLRVDLPAVADEALTALRAATETARRINTRLEVALHLGDDADALLKRLARDLAATAGSGLVTRWLVFHQAENSTSAHWIETARGHLAPATPEAAFVGGTDAYFAELNRGRPPVEACDAVTFSINPQVHAFDDRSLVETLAMQAVAVDSAKRFCGGRPVLVSPVTLRPRFNPNATGPEAPPPPGTLPPSADPRQRLPFAAAWTLGSFKHLAEAGAAAVTYYELRGWRGLFETAEGSPLPDTFPSTPGEVFPVCRLFEELAPFAGGTITPLRSSKPLTAEALLLAAGNRRRLLVANFRPENTSLRIELSMTDRIDPRPVPPAAAAPRRDADGNLTLPGGAIAAFDWSES
ncbi:MAG: hypothetical protein EA425_14875 [Puniceicoccaceae bacterium]|nr:MAG: hypothetical protein EA425_14875 [Puniceicoccaceae bacterium]